MPFSFSTWPKRTFAENYCVKRFLALYSIKKFKKILTFFWIGVGWSTLIWCDRKWSSCTSRRFLEGLIEESIPKPLWIYIVRKRRYLNKSWSKTNIHVESKLKTKAVVFVARWCQRRIYFDLSLLLTSEQLLEKVFVIIR